MKSFFFAILIAVPTVPLVAEISTFLRPGLGYASVSSGSIRIDPAEAAIMGTPVGKFDDTTMAYRLTGGLQFARNWEVALSYGLYGDAETRFAFSPPSIVSIAPLDTAHRIATIDAESFSLIPAYRHFLTPKLSVKLGLGACLFRLKTTWTGGIDYVLAPPNPAPLAVNPASPEVARRDGEVRPTAVVALAWQVTDRLSADLAYRYSEGKVALVYDERLAFHEFEIGATWRF